MKPTMTEKVLITTVMVWSIVLSALSLLLQSVLVLVDRSTPPQRLPAKSGVLAVAASAVTGTSAGKSRAPAAAIVATKVLIDLIMFSIPFFNYPTYCCLYHKRFAHFNCNNYPHLSINFTI